jgi:hypothetical protein
MNPLFLILAGALPLASSYAVAQNPADQPAPIVMPADHASDSYRIYSSLIPLGETGLPGWPHKIWLVADTTIAAVPPDHPCLPPTLSSNDPAFEMNPHMAVHPPRDHMQDYNEILEDFDMHCHDRIALTAEPFHVSTPLRLLSEAEQREFQSTRFGRTPNPTLQAKYKGAPALYSFSEVYFNHNHTTALVYATSWCGGLCGQGFWIAFALENGLWQTLRGWNSVSWIS